MMISQSQPQYTEHLTCMFSENIEKDPVNPVSNSSLKAFQLQFLVATILRSISIGLPRTMVRYKEPTYLKSVCTSNIVNDEVF